MKDARDVTSRPQPTSIDVQALADDIGFVLGHLDQGDVAYAALHLRFTQNSLMNVATAMRSVPARDLAVATSG